MIDIRKDMIKSLDVVHEPCFPDYELEVALCNCLIPKESSSFEDNSKKLSNWLRKCIRSLSYDVNDTCLILSGGQSCGKTTFFDSLLPDEFVEYYIETATPKEFVYDYFIINLDGVESKKYCKNVGYLTMDENFTVRNPYTPKVTTDKRAASYCGTTNFDTKHITRKNMEVIELESINFELYNSINKLELWIELYNKYKLIRNA